MNILQILKLLKNKSGATAIEYGIVSALISIGTIASMQATGNSLESTYHCISGAFTNAGCIRSGDCLLYTSPSPRDA